MKKCLMCSGSISEPQWAETLGFCENCKTERDAVVEKSWWDTQLEIKRFFEMNPIVGPNGERDYSHADAVYAAAMGS